MMYRIYSFSKRIITLALLVVIVALGGESVAQDSLLINYQGYLTDDGGEPLTGDYAMTFTIYDGSGVSQWSERHSSVVVTNGLFAVTLGSQTALPDSVFTGEDRYLGISVEGDDELSPRTLLTSSSGAAVSRRVVGDILTGPGMLLVKNTGGDSAVVIAADPGLHAMRLHPPEPCVPPDPCTPALELVAGAEDHSIVVHPPDPCVPPEPCTPALELIAGAEVHSMKVYPPDPCTTDPCAPVFEVTSRSDSNSMRINWGVPPDDNQPAFELVSDAAMEKVTMELVPPPDDGKPGVELSVDAAAGTSTIRVGTPPPDDNKPSVEIVSTTSSATLTLQGEDASGEPPLIVMSTDAAAAKLGIGTDSLAEALMVMGNGWFSGDVFTFTVTKAKRNIVPIDGALDKVNRMNGYYYDCRTDEYPSLHMPEKRQIGFLAEEVNEVVPEAVGENDYGLTGVSYSRITALLVEAVKELNAENDELKLRIEALEKQ